MTPVIEIGHQVAQRNVALRERQDDLVRILTTSLRSISRSTHPEFIVRRSVALVKYEDRPRLDQIMRAPLADAKLAPISLTPLTPAFERDERLPEFVCLYEDNERAEFGFGIMLRDYPVICLTLSAAQVREHVVPDGGTFEEQLRACTELARITEKVEVLLR